MGRILGELEELHGRLKDDDFLGKDCPNPLDLECVLTVGNKSKVITITFYGQEPGDIPHDLYAFLESLEERFS